MNKQRQTTIETYEWAAPELAEYFKNIGPRTEDINLVFDLLGDVKDPQIVEIGCGDGRDAQEIIARTQNYVGFDVSGSFIDIAKKKIPKGRFLVADAVDFEFPPNTDAIFAFASLLHLDKDEVGQVFAHAHSALKSGGLFYVSVKYKPEYTAEVKTDQFGERLFYFYNDELLINLAGEDYSVVKNWHKILSDTEWLELILQKR